MKKPPLKALESIKNYCLKTQCRICAFGEVEKALYDDLDFVGCNLQQTTPCDWEIKEEKEDEQ